MSEEKTGDISMDKLTGKMGNMNISGEKMTKSEFERLKNDKIAVVTIGRW